MVILLFGLESAEVTVLVVCRAQASWPCKGIYTSNVIRAFVHGDEAVETLLSAIIAMIGYYIVILASAMFLIVIGIQVFKALTARKRRAEPTETIPSSGGPSGETDEEYAAAAIAAVSVFLTSQRTSLSAWPLVERSPHSPWKTAGRSRRISPAGG